MMFDGSKNDSFVVSMICRFFSLYRAMVQVCFSGKIVYIDVADFIHFYCFFIFQWNNIVLSKVCSSNHDSFAKNEKEKEVVVRM